MALSLIVIDESQLDCFIAQKIIQFAYADSTVKLHNNALTAFEAIRDGNTGLALPAVIFLDLQMPIMNGFEFLEAYERLPDDITDQYRIFILSSTLNKNDISRGRTYRTVLGVVEKPLTKEKLEDVFRKYSIG
jgi:CheY-like chemotaxis protein